LPSFKIGDLAIYPMQGVGEIKGIEKRSLGADDQSFYVLQLRGTGTTLMVPTETAGNVLRAVIKRGDVEKVFSILSSKEGPPSTGNWNRRHRHYMEKMKTGSLFDVAEVYRDLSRRKTARGLSYGEKRMLITARTLVVSELAIAQRTQEDRVAEKLDAMFG
jgi:CarD family transcriptional regulator